MDMWGLLQGSRRSIIVSLHAKAFQDVFPLLGSRSGDINDFHKQIRTGLVIPDRASSGVSSHCGIETQNSEKKEG
jgi:hypothetical protein